MGFESIEHLVSGGNFSVQADRIQRVEKKPLSLPRILAENLIEHGVSGLEAFTGARINRVAGTIEVGPGFFQELKDQCSEDLGMLFLGTSIIGLENAIFNRHFSLGEHINVVNSRIHNLPFGYNVSDDQKEKFDRDLTLGNWKNMIALVREDPTYASFFLPQHAANLLPIGLKAFLAGAKGFGHILEILDRYRAAASVAILGIELTDADVQDHRMVLEYFDEMIASIDAKR